jgi:hypothetical protein
MRNHLGCTGTVDLGQLSAAAQNGLQKVEAVWLDFVPAPPRLVVRHVQPDDIPALREIAGELLDFLVAVPEPERAQIPGGALYYLDEESGEYTRLEVLRGGQVSVSWARPDYALGTWEPYRGETVPLVFDAYQRLNGRVSLRARPEAAAKIREAIERFGGLGSQGEFEVRPLQGQIEVLLNDTNTSVLPLLQALRKAAEPPASLEGEIDVSSFRVGDLEDYARFVLRGGEMWLVRPSLWGDAPAGAAQPQPPLERAA